MRSHVHRGCGRGGNRNAYAARPGWTQGTAPPPAGPGPVGGRVRASPPPGHCSVNSVGPAPSRTSEASPRHTGPTACGCIGAIAKTYAARGESPQGHRRLVFCRAGSADPPPPHPQTGARTPVVCRAIGARLRSTAAGCEPSTASGRTGRLTFGPSPPNARSWFLGACAPRPSGSGPAPSGCGDARLRACARATGPRPARPSIRDASADGSVMAHRWERPAGETAATGWPHGPSLPLHEAVVPPHHATVRAWGPRVSFCPKVGPRSPHGDPRIGPGGCGRARNLLFRGHVALEVQQLAQSHQTRGGERANSQP